MRSQAAVLTFAFILSANVAFGEQLHAMFSTHEDPPRAELSVTPCTGEEVEECVSHILTCSKPNWNGLALTIIVGDTDKLAAQLVIGTQGEANGTLGLAGGKVTVDMPIHSVDFGRNELDGGWVVEVGFDDLEGALDAITERNGEQAFVKVGDFKFDITPEKGDSSKLLAFRNACLKLKD